MTTRYEPLDASGICANCGYRRSGHVGKGMVCLDKGGAKVAQEVSTAAKALSRLGASLGGSARDKALSKARKAEIAAQGGKASHRAWMASKGLKTAKELKAYKLAKLKERRNTIKYSSDMRELD